MVIRGLLFDKDGTLFDFQASWSAWAGGLITRLAGPEPSRQGHLAATLGYDLAARRFRPESRVIAGSVETVLGLIRQALPDVPQEIILNELLEGTADVPQAPAADLVPLLLSLRAQGLALGVATNDAEAPAREHLRDAGIHDLFDFIAGYDSGFGAKPAPGMPEAFAAATSLPPHQIAMIGDSTHDLHAGFAAGMARVAVLTGVAGRDDLAPHADVVLDSIADLPDWLASLKPTSEMSQTAMP
ncbi:HAD family hydrolase [Algicella marina]|uniref:phosphoglycolate phosphatase n=1 Tax=Algicella marina TaxID=2683284 RepID=A0A6P1SU70_9RHOB|nr:HAD family hydrolase [Algicella marina]QHQ33978.1 HAD-IA family hydrolase [Algicella marina]